MTTNRHHDPKAERYTVVSCCWPFDGRIGALFWGVALLVLGGVWLVANVFGFEDWSKWLVPTFFVAWGVVLLVDVGLDAGKSWPRNPSR